MEKMYYDKEKGEKKVHHDMDEENIISKAIKQSFEKGDSSKLSKAIHRLMKDLKKEAMEELKDTFIFSLYELANGKHFDECTAEKIVADFKNVDGTEGERWTIKEATAIMKKFRFEPSDDKYNEYDWYVILNMMYSDYANVLGNKEEIHAAMANAYFNGPDEKEGKAWTRMSHQLFEDEED